MTEHVAFFLSVLGMVGSIIGWRWEIANRQGWRRLAFSYHDRAQAAEDTLAEERRHHPKRGPGGRYAKRSATFGADRPVG